MYGVAFDLPNSLLVKQGLVPGTYTTSQNGTVVDFKDTVGPVTAILSIASHDHTTGDETLDVKLQHGSKSDGSDMADISGATFTQVTSTTGAQIQVIKTDFRNGRYVRAVTTAAGTTPSDVMEILLIATKTIQGSGPGNTLAPTT